MCNMTLVSLWFIITVCVKLVESVVPSNVPLMGNEFTREELIRVYFLEGLKYCEIILFLYSTHNIVLSVLQYITAPRPPETTTPTLTTTSYH